MLLIWACIMTSASTIPMAPAQENPSESYEAAIAYLKNRFEICKGRETRKGPETEKFCGCAEGALLMARLLEVDPGGAAADRAADQRLILAYRACRGAVVDEQAGK
jgi:hypothetical protein